MKKASKNKLARIYALALYDAAIEKKVLQDVWNDVSKLEVFLRENTSFLAYLSSPLWAKQDKEDVLKKTSDILKLNDETFRCLSVVCQNHRISELHFILEDFKRVYYQRNNIIEVAVEAVQPLSSAQDKKLKTLLEKILSQSVVIDYRIDPSVLGGLRIKCGSKMFDDSLSAKLNYLEKLMKGK